MSPEAEAAVIAGYRAGKRPAEIAEEIGYAKQTVACVAVSLRKRGIDVPRLGGHGAVPQQPFRDRLEQLRRQGVTSADIARRLGWVVNGQADTSRLHRTLGLLPNSQSSDVRSSMRLETAEKLCEAMGIEPWEVGL